MKKKPKRIPWGWIAAAVALAGLGALAIWYLAPKADWSGLVEEWVDRSGAFGVVVFAGV
jgi:hypothetical protein